jgi:hypothetical protein
LQITKPNQRFHRINFTVTFFAKTRKKAAIKNLLGAAVRYEIKRESRSMNRWNALYFILLSSFAFAENEIDITKGIYDFSLVSNQCITTIALAEPSKDAISAKISEDSKMFCKRFGDMYKCLDYVTDSGKTYKKNMLFNITADSPPHIYFHNPESLSNVYVNLNTRGAVYERRNSKVEGLVTTICNSTYLTKHEEGIK